MKTSYTEENIFKPLFFRLNIPDQKKSFNELVSKNTNLIIKNEIYSQLQELVKIQNPTRKLTQTNYEELISNHLNGKNIDEYGVWLFYPWNNYLIHILDEEEFVTVRTNRNKYKITNEEQDLLSQKKIGIIGLSVGQSIALTIAMERICGELRLADFDTAELSNLNRIRTGLHNLGLKKTIIAAREIAEIDPYINVLVFNEGLNKDNFNQFFLENGKLDLLVEVCDGLDIKIESRFKARELEIPVVMETNDKGMLDIERFDLDNKRPILHGLADGLNPETIKGLSNEDKVPYILKIVGAETISNRLKASMVEVEQTINTWPQLASSVVLGGAVTTDVSRRILLNQFTDSGRYYIDLEQLVANKTNKTDEYFKRTNPFSPLSKEEMVNIISKKSFDNKSTDTISYQTIEKIVEMACLAPSTGNDQPWKWLYQNGILFLFHDEYRSFSFGDYHNLASLLTFGAAYENLTIAAAKEGFKTSFDFSPIENQKTLIAAIYFEKSLNSFSDLNLYNSITSRCTNRNLSTPPVLDNSIYNTLTNAAESIEGAKIQWFKSENELNKLADIIGACDRIRLLNKEGHDDFVNHEMRWTPEQAESTKDGIDVETLGLSNSQLAALGIIKNPETITEINRINGGKGLEVIARKSIKAASALALITLPKYESLSFFNGGRSLERFWLTATHLNLAVHPVISPLYIFPRITHGNGESLSLKEVEELKKLRNDFKKLTGLSDDNAEVFLVKISKAEQPKVKSFRLPLLKVLFKND